MVKKVLVPIDIAHLDQGSGLLEIAKRIGGPDAHLVALYVPPEVPGYVAAEIPEHLISKTDATSAEELAALAKAHGAESKVLKGPTSAVILDTARNMNADLIVLGSHRPGLQDYFLGSTSARVARHAECSVYIHR